ncbi:MAG: hypothetical protein KGK03_01815 [Candidatus Omnitrophica bacterium]|nr:hypothetical protein [Candidatus Omnitrophota bacterium]
MTPPLMLHALVVFIFILICIIVYLVYSFVSREETIARMKAQQDKLLSSFNELDEQAKLIVRTDLELHKTREEMDKRLNGLNALQRTSRQMSQALNESEIFQKISPSLFGDLGFSRILIACINDNNLLKVRLNIGYKDSRADAILKEFESEETLKGLTAALSLNNCPTKTRERIIQIFESDHFILAPVTAQTGAIGFVFAGYGFNAPAMTQGDEELITILAGQIGQSIENARLFEKVFLSSQHLELKVAERTKQLATALQKVNEISRKKSEFISAVSHELRTPLTSIKGYASILIAGKIGDVPAAVKERLSKINTHSDNLVSLINNLLDIARIESNRQEMKFALYKIKSMVDNVADLLAPQMTAKGIKLQQRLCTEVENIYVDASQVERVFINLLGNAIKFTPAQGTVTIGVSPALDEGFAVLSVSDTGIGIPAAEIQKLFNEFFRVDNEINQNVKGTGLGLVLAKNIVAAHHGKIWVESTVGTGTIFYFTLPASQKAFEERINLEKNYAA